VSKYKNIDWKLPTKFSLLFSVLRKEEGTEIGEKNKRDFMFICRVSLL
jgi:hypothetical protein